MKYLPSLKYSASCTECGSPLDAGESAWWDPSSKAVSCTACRPAPGSPIGTKPHVAPTANGPAPPEPDLQSRWVSLIRYYRSCLEREAAAQTTDDRGTESPMSLVPVLAGESNSVGGSDRIAAYLTKSAPGEVVIGGWPTVVISDGSSSRWGPLLVIEFEHDGKGGLLAVEDTPYLDPKILDPSLLAAPACAEARSLVDGGDLTDAASVRGLVEQVLDVLDLGEIADHSGGGGLNPGVHDVSWVYRSKQSIMTKALLEELAALEKRTDWTDTAAAQFLGITRPAGEETQSPLASPLELNDAQERAVDAIRSAPLTVVTGPPGTGKSQFVVGAVANAWLDGRSVLVGSTNNAAVDVAAERAADLHPLLLLRTGNRGFRDRLPDLVGTALDRLPDPVPPEQVARADLARADAARAELLGLIEAQSDLAVELAELTITIEDSAASIWPSGTPEGNPSATEQLPKVRKLVRARLFGRWRRRRLLHRLGATDGSDFGVLLRWAEAGARFVEAEAEMAEVVGQLGDDTTKLSDAEAQLIGVSQAATLATVANRATTNKSALVPISTARVGGPGMATAIRQAMRGALGWATTALSAKQNFPLEAGLFDLVIVDEASQCTVAAILPLAYRAERLAVVGDPNQLNPVVRLDDRQLERLANAEGLERGALDRDGLDYGTGSAYLAGQAVVGADAVRLLDEHYRCHPLIARWFNTAFYGDQLHVLTDVAELADTQRGLTWIDVEGDSERGQWGGVRNCAQAETVVELLADPIAQGASLGVVTPFVAQAALIRHLAEERYGPDALASVDLAVGTAHRFQGQERDLVVFATALAPNTRPATARWVEDQRNLVNVAASRARRALIVIGHPTAAIDLNVPTLASLRKAATEGLPHVESDWMVHSEAEKRLRDAMVAAGLSPLVKPIVEGFELDFGFDSPGHRKLDVEVDGTHHDVRGRQRRRDLVRDRVLRSTGWEVMRVPAWRCLKEQDVVATAVARALSLHAH